MATIGFKQNVLHTETGSPQPDRHKQPPGFRRGCKFRPCVAKFRRRFGVTISARNTHFLLPKRDDIEDDGNHRRALDDLDELGRCEIDKQTTEHQRTEQHSDKQHDIEQRDDALLAEQQLEHTLALLGAKLAGHRSPTGSHPGAARGRRLAGAGCHHALRRELLADVVDARAE